MPRLMPGFLALALIFMSGCSDMHVMTDYDSQADMSGVKTYAWLPQATAPDMKSPMDIGNPMVHDRIHAAIERELTAKGLTKVVKDKADVLVGYFLSADNKTTYHTVDEYYGYGRFPYSIPSYSRTRTIAYNYTEGTLVIDFADAKTSKLIWRGAAQAELLEKPEPAKVEARINKAVNLILEDFPPKK